MRSWEIATCWGSFRPSHSLISILSLEESSSLKFLNLCAMEFLFRLNLELYIVAHSQYVFLAVHFPTNAVFTSKTDLFWELAKADSWGTLLWPLLSSCRFCFKNFTNIAFFFLFFFVISGVFLGGGSFLFVFWQERCLLVCCLGVDGGLGVFVYSAPPQFLDV